MTIPIKAMTVIEFDKWVLLPENSDKSYEYIGGELAEVVLNNYSSLVAARILYFITHYIMVNKIKGYVTGADGGYIVAGERYIPDVAYISAEQQADPSHDAYNPNPPDLAVEVVSPSDSERNLAIKVANYLSAGTIVWVIYPERKELNICAPQEAVKTLSEDDVILHFQGKVARFKVPARVVFTDELPRNARRVHAG